MTKLVSNCYNVAVEYDDFNELKNNGEITVTVPFSQINYNWAIVGCADNRSGKYLINSFHGLVMADITKIVPKNQFQELTLRKVHDFKRGDRG